MDLSDRPDPTRAAKDESSKEVVALLLEARATLRPALEVFFEAGCPTDPQSVRAVGPHIYDAVRALVAIGDTARQVTGVAAESVGVLEPHLRALN